MAKKKPGNPAPKKKAIRSAAPRQTPPAAQSALNTIKPFAVLPRLTPLAQMIALALVALVLYANSIPNEYAVDDAIVLKENDFVKQGLGGIPEILGNETFVGYWGKQKDLLAGGRYRPLSLVMFAIEYQIAPDTPALHHAVNVLLFMALILIIFNFFRKTAAPHWPELAFWAAFLFAIHPIHTESVANIKGRDEILSLLLLVPALGYFIRAAQQPLKQSKYFLYAAVLLFFGLLAKENGLTFLAIVPLTLWAFAKARKAQIAAGTVVTFGVIVLYLTLRGAVVGGLFGGAESTDVLNNPYNNDVADVGFSEKYGTILYVLGKYFGLLFWPHPLSWDYSYAQIPYVGLGAPVALLSAALYIGLLALGVYCLQKKYLDQDIKYAGWGAMFFLFSLFISSNILVNIGAFMAERLLFQPSLGFSVAIAALVILGLGRLSSPSARRAAGLCLLGLLLIAGGAKIIDRNADWKNDQTLRIHDVRNAPNSAKTNLGAGEAYFNMALDSTAYAPSERTAFFDSAHKYYDRAKEIYPKFNDAYLKAGLTYLWQDEFDKAWRELKIAKQLYPQNERLIKYIGVLKGEYFQRSVDLRKSYFKAKEAGNLDVAEQRLGQAIHWMEKAVEADPAYAEAWGELGGLYSEGGNYARSVQNFEKAVKYAPQNADFHFGLGLTHFFAGQYRQAVPHLENALKIKPNMNSARQVLQDARARMGGAQSAP